MQTDSLCSEHDCPLIRVGEHDHCLFEYVEGLVGGQRLVQVVPGDDETPLTLVFENGRAMPLYCPDCGGPLLQAHSEDEETLHAIVGWHLYALGYASADGAEPEYLELIWAPLGDVDDDTAPVQEQCVCVHLDSARQIR